MASVDKHGIKQTMESLKKYGNLDFSREGFQEPSVNSVQTLLDYVDQVAGKVLLGATSHLDYARQIAAGARKSDPQAVVVLQLVENSEGKRP